MEEGVYAMVWPSGGCLSIYPRPMVALPPGRFSTMMGWSHFGLSLSANSRSRLSDPLPGGLGLIMLTWRDGKFCAAAGNGRVKLAMSPSETRPALPAQKVDF